MSTTTTTTRELEIELTMHKYSDAADIVTRTLTINNPVTTAGGMSAIADFRAYLLTTEDSTATALQPYVYFQPQPYTSNEDIYVTDSTSARIVETTKTVTDI